MYICTCMLRDTTEIQNSRYATAIFQLVMKSSKSGEFEMLRTPPPPGGRGGAPTPSRFRYKKTSIYPSKYSGNTGYRYNAVCLRGLRHLAARDSIGRLFHSISLSIINLCMYNILKSLREAGKDIEYSSVSRTLYFPKNHGQENIGCSSLARYGSSFCFCILLTIVEI